MGLKVLRASELGGADMRRSDVNPLMQPWQVDILFQKNAAQDLGAQRLIMRAQDAANCSGLALVYWETLIGRNKMEGSVLLYDPRKESLYPIALKTVTMAIDEGDWSEMLRTARRCKDFRYLGLEENPTCWTVPMEARDVVKECDVVESNGGQRYVLQSDLSVINSETGMYHPGSNAARIMAYVL